MSARGTTRQAWVGGALAALLGVASAVPAMGATATASTTSTLLVSAPPDARLNQYTSATEVRVWQERSLTLPAALAVDTDGRPADGRVDALADLSGASIAAGTAVDSSLMHADQPGTTPTSWDGAYTFPTDVLGFILTDARLDATDGSLGSTTTVYGTGTFGRKLELPGDWFELGPDRRTVTSTSPCRRPSTTCG